MRRRHSACSSAQYVSVADQDKPSAVLLCAFTGLGARRYLPYPSIEPLSPLPQGIINNPNFSRYVRYNAMQVRCCSTRSLSVCGWLGAERTCEAWSATAPLHCRRHCCCFCFCCKAVLLQSCAAATSAIRFVQTCPLQAILLDIILILPGLIESIVRPPMAGPGLQVYITL